MFGCLCPAAQPVAERRRSCALAGIRAPDYECSMPERADFRTDLISVLAIASGVAVVLPSLVFMLISILAVLGIGS